MNSGSQDISFNRVAFPTFLLAGLGLAAGLLWSRRATNSPKNISRVDEQLRTALKKEDRKNFDFPKQVDLEPASKLS